MRLSSYNQRLTEVGLLQKYVTWANYVGSCSVGTPGHEYTIERKAELVKHGRDCGVWTSECHYNGGLSKSTIGIVKGMHNDGKLLDVWLLKNTRAMFNAYQGEVTLLDKPNSHCLFKLISFSSSVWVSLCCYANGLEVLLLWYWPCSYRFNKRM